MSAGDHVLTCPLCGLRYHARTELELHAREDHAPPPQEEGRETLHVPHPTSAHFGVPAARRPSRGVHGRRA